MLIVRVNNIEVKETQYTYKKSTKNSNSLYVNMFKVILRICIF